MAEEEDLDQDELAAAWGAALDDADDGDDSGDSARSQLAGMLGDNDDDVKQNQILTQDEVDALVGFSLDRVDMANQVGLQALVDSAKVSHERLPMLEVIFDRLVRLLTTSLRNFTSDNVEVSVETIGSMRFGDYLDSIGLPSMIGVFNASEWNNYGLITIGSNLVYGVVDVLLGGRALPATRVEGRPFTTIENSLVSRMIKIILDDANLAFEPLTPINFQLDRIETNPRFSSIARMADACVVITLRIEMEDRGGHVQILFPNATLEPVRSLLLQGFLGERFGQDSIWEEHLADEVWQTEIPIEVTLDELNMPLQDIMDLKVGDTLALTKREDDEVLLHSGVIDLGSGRMGRRNGHIAIRLSNSMKENLNVGQTRALTKEVA